MRIRIDAGSAQTSSGFAGTSAVGGGNVSLPGGDTRACNRRGLRTMRVWPPGGHPELIKRSRSTTGRGAGPPPYRSLARLTRPYRARTALSVVSLLAATATALLPPTPAKYAVDDAIGKNDLGKLWWIVGAFVLAGLLNWAMSYVQTHPSPAGSANGSWPTSGIPGCRHLQRLSLGFSERTRAGVIISRLTNDVEAIDQLVTTASRAWGRQPHAPRHRDPASFVLDWRLALAARSHPADEPRDGDLPRPLDARLPGGARAVRGW